MAGQATDYDAVVIGAGFSGMYMLIKLRELGLRTIVFEAGSDVGGTWYWNRYPGCRCDVESMEYSYSFDDDLQQDWQWTERYPSAPEIHRYTRHVAERFDLRCDIQFDTRVTAAFFDEATDTWRVSTDRGDDVRSPYLICAVGSLSAANYPQLDGMDDFEGTLVHTGRWPEEGVDYDGKRVAVVGTGSSGVQSIPVIAETAGHLTVFQRTAQYAIPAGNRPLSAEDQEAIKAEYPAFREEQRRQQGALGARLGFRSVPSADFTPEEIEAEYERRWADGGFTFLGAFNDTATPERNHLPADFVKRKIREKVHDPETAEKLMPKMYIGCKRMILDTGYFETYNRANVELVDISESPIERITANGVLVDGQEYEVDVLIFATGYDAMTGSLLRLGVTGRDGVALEDAWDAGPVTYLGIAVPNFPNMFIMAGPGSPSVLANMITCGEQHGDWIAACIASLRDGGHSTIEATPEAASEWVEHVNKVAGTTLLSTCSNWYLGANIPGKPRVFMPLPGFPAYVKKCDEVSSSGYEGFVLS